MKIEDQVCTLEQAQKLKELGISFDAIFCYVNGEIKHMPMRYDFNAFTVAELGVMLPDEEYTCRYGGDTTGNWEWCNDMNEVAYGLYDTEAQARAERLIVLLEKGEVTVAEVNERLAA